MFLKWGAPTSPGMRHKRWIHFDFFFKLRNPKLTTKRTRRVGRTQEGNRSVFSKGKAYSSYLYRQAKTPYTYALNLGMVLEIGPQGVKKSCYALVKTAIGAWYYMIPTQHNILLSYMRVNDPLRTGNIPLQLSWYWQLGATSPNSRMCCIQLAGTLLPKYAISPGSTCILVAPELWEGWSFILLPSRQAKLVDSLSWALQGSPSPVFKRNTNNAKAIKYLLTGKSSQVRGVAKNPNDHPHGGRTKTVKYPRTPWGRTTKKSRAPALHAKLRPLLKRTPKLKFNDKLAIEHNLAAIESTEEASSLEV